MVRFIIRGRGGRKVARRLAGGNVGRIGRSKAVPRTTVAMAKYVNKLINRKTETKYVANAYADNNTAFAANWFAPIQVDTLPCYHPGLPRLTAGTGDYQRIGARIQPTKVYTDLTVGFASQDLSCNEVMCVIYYGTCKAGKTWQNTTPIQSANDLLDNGDGTTQVFGGVKSDLLLPINKHMYNAKRKVFKLAKVAGVLNQTGALAPGALATSNGPSFKTVRLNFKVPKSLQYDQTTHGWPSNYAPWFAISYCRVDDSNPRADEELINVSSLSHMYFKDM